MLEGQRSRRNSDSEGGGLERAVVSNGSLSGHSQLVSHLFDGQDRNKFFDAGFLLKLASFGNQNLLDCGKWTRELFRVAPNEASPLHWLGLDGHRIFPQGNEYIHRGLVLHLERQAATAAIASLLSYKIHFTRGKTQGDGT